MCKLRQPDTVINIHINKYSGICVGCTAPLEM